ncbi:response regulator receiver [Gelatoporia subvermispora B]|uniref:Response regulator receiver n=1 Tax=Ceriporiopsis subvermispora (strain B) TaxID=914234 RepID=M2R0K0_CERS8|nr:response regulator receiver [Gelatoporia subvermispora B]
MMGAYQETDVARATLAQMNEISRIAAGAGMSFAQPAAPASSAGPSSAPVRPPSSASRIMAAAAGLLPNGAEAPVRPMSRQDALARIEELARARPASAQGGSQSQSAAAGAGGPASADGQGFDAEGFLTAGGDERYRVPVNSSSLSHEGLQVFTVGHLMPRSGLDDENGNWTFDANALNAVVMPTPQGMGGDPEEPGESVQQPFALSADPAAPYAGEGQAGPSSAPARPASAQTLRVRRSTYVPGWAVPPRVLLVDDDAVSRKLSSKFLQVFGCTIDVAVDGIGAVNKMNLEKYDLVLMDIVMPKLDGVSATSLIRQFDHMTPIISMTSNSKPNEIIKYYSSGMNDILPKPFTKDGLLDMLEKHLMHLKVIQTMSKIPRSVGIPPLSDPSFDRALAVQAQNAQAAAAVAGLGFPLGDDEGKINPLAGMGLTDEQYALILQNLVNGENFAGVAALDGSSGLEKRPLEDAGDARDTKRGRFEIIE